MPKDHTIQGFGAILSPRARVYSLEVCNNKGLRVQGLKPCVTWLVECSGSRV